MRDRDAHTAGADEVTDMEIFEADGSINPKQIRLDAQNKALPNRLHRLRKLPWFECYLAVKVGEEEYLTQSGLTSGRLREFQKLFCREKSRLCEAIF